MQNTDWEIIQACRQGHAQGWETLLHQYQRLVYSIPLNYGLSGDDAADIVQITFTFFLQNLADLREDSHLASWLATVAKRHTWRLMQKKRRESPHGPEDLNDSPLLLTQPSTHKPMERTEMVQWLEQGLTQLEGRCQNLLTALYFDPVEPSYQEVATKLHLPVGSIGPMRARCLQKLKEVLEHLA